MVYTNPPVPRIPLRFEETRVPVWKMNYYYQYVPLILPWLLPSAMFSIVVAAVHAWKTDSLQFAFLFVVLPLAIWIVILKSCAKQLHDPVFAPSFVTAVVITDIVTFIVVLRPAINAGLEVAFAFGAITLLVLYWRVIHSDPGRVAFSVESSACIGEQDRTINPQPEEIPPLEGWNEDNLEGEPLKATDLETGESHQALENSVTNEVTEGGVHAPEAHSLKPLQPARSRYCRKCNALIDHFDHHCPAIKNCVGRKNHVLFLGALTAFIVAEVLYVRCCFKYFEYLNLLAVAKDVPSSTPIGLRGLEHVWLISCQVMSTVPWVTISAVFAAFQAFWQVLLLLFHVYCASVNLTTSEWIKWERYPYLYIELPVSPDRPYRSKKFVNPYDQGVFNNLKQFFRSRV
ncbi:uncharacterized protein [Physcomitrium patens]|uniref:S-acyltransferase n=1 Tax=Physcomitrium patens TaxID=3218 RepID=A0A2K1J0Y2_PHYPA|nr:palmitoyltransferase PFA4-like isoform X3 [Physcomitrium patens]PNR35188.1 hypothetical protein PHYPA_023087 [Physcomitrium patens]|eukprot:XP_024402916.1 palmitoyltransferase PFA4-like isoform X3 [Physcomitrella patens]